MCPDGHWRHRNYRTITVTLCVWARFNGTSPVYLLGEEPVPSGQEEVHCLPGIHGINKAPPLTQPPFIHIDSEKRGEGRKWTSLKKPLSTEGCPAEVLDQAVPHTSDGLGTTGPAPHTSLPSWLQRDAPGHLGDSRGKVWRQPRPKS